MLKKKRSAIAWPSTAPVDARGKPEKKAVALLNKAATALRPSARRLWGKPKPVNVLDLQVGDLAFSRFLARIGDSVSSAVTGYPPMHVSLYVGNGRFFDLSEKAKIVSAGVLSNYYPNPFIFRPKLSEEQREKIVALAMRMAKEKTRKGGKIREIIGWQRTLGIRVKNPKEQGYICSNSIAEFFEKAGADLVPGVHPLRASPTDLMKSKKLEVINA
jgi:cell wall-associated NlpC family hydrolase